LVVRVTTTTLIFNKGGTMREYTFVRGDGDKKVIEARSLKKAIIKYGGKPIDNDKFVHINWQSKKGNSSYKILEVPYVTRKERKGKL
tara:strand:+ start:459 stop:719 length:261 start_codon:yes stop_codon:yes gene_type:complete